jgi:hypothetical protein
MGLLGTAAALFLLTTQAAPAQPARPDADLGQNTVEEVVVQGRRDAEAQRKAVSEFVGELSAPSVRERLPRWERGLCPGVVGLPQKQASYIADRIAMEALAVGLEVGEPGCRPDVLILVTNRPDETAAEFRRRHGRFFAHLPRAGEPTGGGGQDLKSFLTTPRPVRWWHVSRRSASEGRSAAGGLLQTTAASRLASNWKEDLNRVLLIVDTKKMKGVSYEALASYLAMVSLAQIDADAAPQGLPSILGIFRDRDAGVAGEETLTDWDRAYLRGLYAAPENARNLNAQKGAIRRSLQKPPR